MLKFFRRYNKYILVFGVSVLMVVFLVQGTVQMWMPSGGSTPLGTIENGQVTVTYGQRRQASIELDVLARLGLTQLPPLNQANPSNADLRYYLLLYEARKLGLSASQAETSEVLAMLSLTKDDITQLATQYRAKPAFIHQVVRHWLMIEAYRDLALGHAFQNVGVGASSPGLRMLQLKITELQAEQSQQYRAMLLAHGLIPGSQRVSQPLLAHFLQDIRSTVSGRFMVISSDRYLKQVPAPTDAQLQSLFAKYKDDLPGQSKPYGFGYRIPNRVKLDYLVVPLAQVQKTIHIDEATALTYYQTHKDQFTTTPASDTEPASTQPSPSISKYKPYIEVRQQIIDQLQQTKAQDLATRMIKTAQSLLLGDVRSLPRVDGYRQLPKNFSPTPLTTIAQELDQQFHVKPIVHHHDKQWVAANDLSSLPVIGQAEIGSGRDSHSFEQYVLSAKQLNPSTDNALVARNLQVGVASDPLSSSAGPVIFRLTAAQPTRDPKNLDAVRRQVVSDAKKLEAYHMLLGKKPQLLQQVLKQGMTKVADSLNVTTFPFTRMPRRKAGAGGLEVPPLTIVGQSQALVDAIFQTANSARQSHAATTPVAFSTLPQAKRIGGTGIDEQLSLALFQVNGYEQMTQEEFQQRSAAMGPILAEAASASLQSPATQNPLSLDALKARLDFKEAGAASKKSTSPSSKKPLPQKADAGTAKPAQS